MKSNRERNKLSDEHLLQSYQNTDRIEFLSTLYLRYTHLVVGTCMKYLKNEETAKDASIDIFEELIIIAKKHEIKSFKSWLYVLTKNHCLMILRKNKKVKLESEASFQNFVDESNINSELRKLKEDRISALEKAIDHLNPQQRDCIKLFYLQEKSYQQIASELDISGKSVKSFIQNAKRNLKLILEKNHVFRS